MRGPALLWTCLLAGCSLNPQGEDPGLFGDGSGTQGKVSEPTGPGAVDFDQGAGPVSPGASGPAGIGAPNGLVPPAPDDGSVISGDDEGELTMEHPDPPPTTPSPSATSPAAPSPVSPLPPGEGPGEPGRNEESDPDAGDAAPSDFDAGAATDAELEGGAR